MPLDPTIDAVLTLAGQAERRGSTPFTPERARAGLRMLAVDIRSPTSVATVGHVEDRMLDGADAPGATPLPLRIYRPVSEAPTATVVFFHGGGFVIGDLDTHDNHCRWLCRESGAVVVSVDYRRAPEAPFPAAVEDCLAATRWAAREIGTLGGRRDLLAVAGDSAGGNLAAVIAQQCRDDGGPALTAQLLVYPVVDLTTGVNYPSRRENAEGYLLTADAMRWFRSCYLGDAAADGASPLCSPILGKLAGLPPAVVVTMEYDPLRDEGAAYADALTAAGVPVVPYSFDGLIHGSFELPILPPACVDAMRTAFGSFRAMLYGERTPR
jgi:acetyl esterase